MLPLAADESEVRGYIFRFLSQLSILAPELGLGKIATVLSCAVLGSLGKDLMSGLTCVWKQTGITCLLVDHEAQNATAVLVVDIMAVANSCCIGLFLCNQAASDRCVCADFEYIGSGSNRNFCFTDLLLRERRTTDIAHLSAANWGIIEVKGAWQLSLPESMSLAAAIEHCDYCKKVLPALQQVCMMISAKVQSSRYIVLVQY